MLRQISQSGQVLALATVYFAAAKLALPLAIPPGYATAVWPPSGIALAAVLLFGNLLWPGVWLGAALVNLTVQASLPAAVLIGTGNTLEALAGAALVRRCIGLPRGFASGEDDL
jgi:integral membrane sensor domain MASE1